MREAVIFPKPEEVNIIATRNGVLTQIPGTEFRTPIAPYETHVEFHCLSDYWGKDHTLEVHTNSEVTAIPLTMHEWNNSYNDYSTIPTIFPQNVRINSGRGIDEEKITRFKGYAPGYRQPPVKGSKIAVLVQLIGNRSTLKYDASDDTGITKCEVGLPYSHSELVLIGTVNQLEEDAWIMDDQSWP